VSAWETQTGRQSLQEPRAPPLSRVHHLRAGRYRGGWRRSWEWWPGPAQRPLV